MVIKPILRNLVFSIFIMILSTLPSWSQQDERDLEDLNIKKEDRPIKKITHRDDPRPKIAELQYEVLGTFSATSESDQFGASRADIDKDRRIKIKLKFPLVLKSKLNIIGGIGYRNERFSFDNIEETNYPIYQRLENRSLKQVAVQIYLKKDLENQKFLFGYFANSLNSDEIQLDNFFNQLKTSLSVVMGKQRDEDTQIGFGISFGFDFGRPRIYPLFIYNKRLDYRWDVQLLLPKEAKLRYTISAKMHLLAKIGVSGTSYHLQDQPLEGFNKLELRQSSIRFRLALEREIYDWLWFGIKPGYNLPINLFISEPKKSRKDSIINIDAEAAPFINLQLFAVVPRHLWKKAKGR